MRSSTDCSALRHQSLPRKPTCLLRRQGISATASYLQGCRTTYCAVSPTVELRPFPVCSAGDDAIRGYAENSDEERHRHDPRRDIPRPLPKEGGLDPACRDD